MFEHLGAGELPRENDGRQVIGADGECANRRKWNIGARLNELRGPLDLEQRRSLLLQARAEIEQQLRTIDERLETLTHMRAELADRLARIDQLLHHGDMDTWGSH